MNGMSLLQANKDAEYEFDEEEHVLLQIAVTNILGRFVVHSASAKSSDGGTKNVEAAAAGRRQARLARHPRPVRGAHRVPSDYGGTGIGRGLVGPGWLSRPRPREPSRDGMTKGRGEELTW